MRVPLPVPLIREMDTVIINGIGGYSTRAEFIIDAIQERIFELTIHGVEDAGPPPMAQRGAPGKPGPPEVLASQPEPSDASTPATVEMTELAPRNTGFDIKPSHDLSQPEGEALFGLHNRDYPALWALSRLAEMAHEEPIPITDYYKRVLLEAWDFGKRLLTIEKRTGTKCTALFPANPDKRQSAETRFLTFAIGNFRIGGNNTITTSGPLYEWRTVGLSGSTDKLQISLTAAGWHLLGALRGISVKEPHTPASATAFLAHLQKHAPADRRGFTEIMRGIGPSGVTRHNLLDHVATQWPDWSNNKVSTNVAGYIARAREWGLVEPKQNKSQYHLTLFGMELLKGGTQ